MRAPAAVPIEIRAQSVTSQVAEHLRARIVKGELAPGERLVEQQLARSLGVGQNAVREALIELAHRGFVRRVANRATYVTSLSFDEAEKLAQVRGALEGLAVELAAERLRARQVGLDALEAWLKEMRKAARAGDREAFYAADLAWHRELWRLSGNEYLAQSLEQIVAPLFAFFIMLHLRVDNRAASFLEAVAAHERVAAALKARRKKQASTALQDLVDLSVKDQQGLISRHAKAVR